MNLIEKLREGNDVSLEDGLIQIATEVPEFVDPDDVDTAKSRIDEIVSGLSGSVDNSDPRRSIRVMNRYFFDELGFEVEKEYPELLPEVLDTRQANCLGMSSLYLVVSERLKLPIYGVSFSGHMFIRWDDGETRINIETERNGEERTDSFYSLNFGTVTSQLKNRATQALLLEAVISRSVLYADKSLSEGDESYRQIALGDLNGVLDIDPNNFNALMNRSKIHYMEDNCEQMLSDALKADEILPGQEGALRRIGIGLLVNDRHAQAIEYFDNMIDRDPHDITLRVFRAMASASIPTEDTYRKALEDMSFPTIKEGLILMQQDLILLPYAQRALTLYHQRYGNLDSQPVPISALVSGAIADSQR